MTPVPKGAGVLVMGQVLIGSTLFPEPISDPVVHAHGSQRMDPTLAIHVLRITPKRTDHRMMLARLT